MSQTRDQNDAMTYYAAIDCSHGASEQYLTRGAASRSNRPHQARWTS